MKSVKHIVLEPGQPARLVTCELTLDYLQATVGSYVEHVDLTVGDLWLNEEGKYAGLAANPAATELLHESGGMPWDIVVGTVLVTGAPGRDVPQSLVDRLVAVPA